MSPGSNAPDALAFAAGRAASLPVAAAALVARLTFPEAQDLVATASGGLIELDGQLRTLRSRGYPWRRDLEATLAQAHQHAGGALSAVQSAVAAAAHGLSTRVSAFQAQIQQVIAGDPRANADALAALVEEQKVLEDALAAADGAVEAAGAPLIQPFQAVSAAVTRLLWALDQFAETPAPLAPGERPVAAVTATWADPPDRLDKQGLILLTDHCFRFEQKEVFVTERRKPGFAADTSAVHQIWIDEPHANVAAVDDHSSGWLVKSSAVAVSFGPGAKAPRTVTLALSSTGIGQATGPEIAALCNALRAGNFGLLG